MVVVEVADETGPMQDYEQPQQNVLTTSASMYGRIRAWLLHGHDELPPELIRGDLVNQKVISGLGGEKAKREW